VLTSQTFRQIRESGNYIYGIGQSGVYEIADKQALSDLISQISINVQDSLIVTRIENNGNFDEYAKSIINTYSSVTLNNALRIEEQSKGIYTVLRYLLKEELDKMFEKRQKAILEYTKEGIRSEWKLQIGDALRNFYWANILLRSHPSYNNMRLYSEKDTFLLKVFLPNRINEIFSNINIKVIDQLFDKDNKYIRYTIGLSYKDEPIQNLDYSFKYKNSWSSTISANDGLACLEYFGEEVDKYKDVALRIEYMYKDKAFFDKDVQSVFSSYIDLPYFSNCEIKTQIDAPTKQKANTTENKKENLNTNFNEIEKIGYNNIQKIISNIEQGLDRIDTSLFTAEGLSAYRNLINYGHAVLLKSTKALTFVKTNNEYMVRSIPMQFTFSRNCKFIEEVVFVLSKEGKVDGINFSLGEIAINDILTKDERFATQDEKYFLIHFLENYKTAYCLKNIEYIQNIFDEDALIIVGNVLKKYKGIDKPYLLTLTENEINYQRFTKTEYMERLRRIFSNNEFINIHFEDNIVKKAKKDMSIYGIQIAQHYTSESYADKGYLFLLVDLRDTFNPIIHVRTWQPNKNEDGSIYGLEDFPFEKL
jgi:hypothetical protein